MSENMQTCPSCNDLNPIEYVLCVWCGFDLTAEHIRRSGIIIQRKEAIDRLKRLIKSPVATFKEIVLIPDLKAGKLLLYWISMIITLNMILIFSKINDLSFNDNDSAIIIDFMLFGVIHIDFDLRFKLIINILFLIFQPLILYLVFNLVWKISTRIMLLATRSFGGKGDYLKVRSTIGYSLLPVFLGWAAAWLIRLITPSVSGSANSFTSTSDLMNSFSKEGFGFVGQLFIIIGWVWSAVLGIIGVGRATKLSPVESILVIGTLYAFFMSIVL
ncbi:MAG: YIP1 family protein [Candidatus Heimdallarchaeota archaeon]|nr:YIP1 family protein [Candidatus Heimdallarchaeota archaeon]